MDDVKKVFEDKTKLAYTIAFLIVGLFAFLLLGKYDAGKFLQLMRAEREAINNMNIMKDLAGYKNFTSQFDSQFVGATSSSQLIDIMGKLAEKNNIAPGSVKPLETRVVSGYRIVRITAEGIASYANLVRLLAALEDYKTYVFIENITIRMSEADPLSGDSPILIEGVARNLKPGGELEKEDVSFVMTLAAIDKGA